MKKFLTVLTTAMALTVGVAMAEPPVEYNAHNNETLTVGATATPFTPSKLLPRSSAYQGGTRNVTFTVDDATIRWWVDGSSPTATAGHIAGSSTTVTINGYDNIRNFKAIRTGAVDAKLQVTYEH